MNTVWCERRERMTSAPTKEGRAMMARPRLDRQPDAQLRRSLAGTGRVLARNVPEVRRVRPIRRDASRHAYDIDRSRPGGRRRDRDISDLTERLLSRATNRGLEHPLPPRTFPELVFGGAEQVFDGADSLDAGCVATREEATHRFAIRGEVSEACDVLPHAAWPLSERR
jgi:hypothetical protein